MVDVIVERCAGLDVHRDTVVATVRLPGSGKSRRRRVQETRTFGTTIGQLERLCDWLAECGVTRVGMESTGCYWKTVFYALENRFGPAGSARLVWRPKTASEIDEETATSLFKLLETLEDSDDVQNVYASFEVAEDMIARLGA